MAGVSDRVAPYTGSRSALRPSIEMIRRGPWCGGDSRAYSHPARAAPATVMKKSTTMSVACQRRTGAARRATRSVRLQLLKARVDCQQLGLRVLVSGIVLQQVGVGRW